MKKEISRDEFIKKRIERQRKLRKRRLIAFFTVFIIMLLCIGVVLSFTVFFPIEKITVKGSEIYTAEEILKKSEISKGDNLFAISKGKVENILKEKLPYVESIDLERKLPGVLTVTVKDAVEFAAYEINDIYYIVSSNGWVLDKSPEQPENLLTITANKAICKVGSEIRFNDLKEQEILNQIIGILDEEEIKINKIDITNILEIKLRVENRFDVNLGTSNNITEKIKHLNGMIKEIPENKVGEINLSMWTNTNKNGTTKLENN